MVLYLCRMCQCGLHSVLWSLIDIFFLCFSSLHNLAVSKKFYCLLSKCGTIFKTLCSQVWDCMVVGFKSKARASLYWCKLPFCLLLFSLSLISLYWLILWGCDLRTDRKCTLIPVLALQVFLVILTETGAVGLINFLQNIIVIAVTKQKKCRFFLNFH